jgi:basic amino acid/polyamine antiporter, APA family
VAGLRRTLTLRDAIAINLGAIIGSGIFVVTGIAAGEAGPALFISILIAAAISLLTALSLVALSGAVAREGGIYAYVSFYVSPYAGFLAGWMYMLGNILTGAAVALGFAFYFGVLVPGVDLRLVIVVIISLFTMINYFGAKDSAKLNNMIVLVKMCILAFFIVFGVFFIKSSNLAPIQPLQGGVLLGAFYIFFAFGGFARITTLSEEVDRPLTNVPKAIMLSLAISTVFYILVGMIAIGMAGAPGLASSNSPLEFAMGVTNNNVAVTLVVVGGLLATSSVLLTSILGVSRIEYSMARKNQFPSVFARLGERSGIPYIAVIVTGAVTMALALTGDLVSVIAIATFSQLFYYSLTNVSAAKMTMKVKKRLPLVPILGAISCIFLLAMVIFISPWTFLLGILCLVAGTAAYMIKRPTSGKL